MTTTTTLAIGEDVPLALVNGQAPTELRLFRAGKNPSTKGEFTFDETAARKVMSAYTRMGRNWVMVDYDHGSLQRNPVDPSASSKSAGRARLELRGGELWATDIRWTPAAKASIEAGEWPSISPAFEHDDEGRPTWLINFGLTGNPALHGPAELIAANVLRAVYGPFLDPTDEPEAAQLASTQTGREPDTAAPAETTNMKKTPAELAAFLGISEDDAKEMLNFIFGDKKREKAMSAAVALSAGLPADADEKTVVARLSALAAGEGKLLSALGVKDVESALGAITGLQKAAKDAEALSRSLADIQGKQLRSEVEALLSAAKAEKKITPAEAADESEHGLRATALSMGEKGPSWLGAHLKARPVIAALSTNYQEPKTDKPAGADPEVATLNGKTWKDLTFAERAKLRDENPELAARMKAAAA